MGGAFCFGNLRLVHLLRGRLYPCSGNEKTYLSKSEKSQQRVKERW
jgi:hypothetical protein